MRLTGLAFVDEEKSGCPGSAPVLNFTFVWSRRYAWLFIVRYWSEFMTFRYAYLKNRVGLQFLYLI